MAQISLRLVNAIRRPSGENAGSAGAPGTVRRRALPPLGPVTSRSPERLALPSKASSPLVPLYAACAEAAHAASTQAVARMIRESGTGATGNLNTGARRSVRPRAAESSPNVRRRAPPGERPLGVGRAIR